VRGNAGRRLNTSQNTRGVEYSGYIIILQFIHLGLRNWVRTPYSGCSDSYPPPQTGHTFSVAFFVLGYCLWSLCGNRIRCAKVFTYLQNGSLHVLGELVPAVVAFQGQRI